VPVPAPEIASPVPEPAPVPLAAPAAPAVEIERAFHAGDDLKRLISRWIREHSDADFDEVARTANRYMREVGFPLVLNVAGLIPPGANQFRMKAGIQTFTFASGRELSPDVEVCGERFLRIPGRFIGNEQAVLMDRDQEFPFSLQGFKREKFKVWNHKKLVSTLFAPDPSEPIGVAANGTAVYLKFPLDDGPTAPWWVRMARQQPALLDEDPYLAIRVSKNSLYFDENLEHLPPQDFDVEVRKDGTLRWAFANGMVLELDSRCGPKIVR
jgi:hypothetical protein